jgi:hypothetical protein
MAFEFVWGSLAIAGVFAPTSAAPTHAADQICNDLGKLNSHGTRIAGISLR